MVQFSTLYDLFEVRPDPHFDPAALKKSYRRLAREWHPDTCQHPQAADRFAYISTGYDVLRDPERRAAYDELATETIRTLSREVAERPRKPTRPPAEPAPNPVQAKPAPCPRSRQATSPAKPKPRSRPRRPAPRTLGQRTVRILELITDYDWLLGPAYVVVSLPMFFFAQQWVETHPDSLLAIPVGLVMLALLPGALYGGLIILVVCAFLAPVVLGISVFLGIFAIIGGVLSHVL